MSKDKIEISREDLAKLIVGQITGALYCIDQPMSAEDMIKLKEAMMLNVVSNDGIKKGIEFYDTIISKWTKIINQTK